MNRKQIAVLGCGGALLAAGAAQQLALGPQWQTAVVNFLSLAILFALLAAFVRELRWAPIIAWMTTLACYDLSLLIRPPMPSFLIWMYTALALMGGLLYLSVSGSQLEEFGRSLTDLLDSQKLKPYRIALLALIPIWAGAAVWAKTGSGLAPPVYPRSVHPAPPDQSDFKGKGYALATLENPYRKLEKENPEKFAAFVAEGKRVYYQNCFLCHGDHLNGQGPFAPALNPRPANFQDPGTIAMLQESFVFWRVAKGGPGMPASGHPWSSAMPQWEKTLSEDEIWKAILWLYDYTGQSPRTWAEETHP